MKPDAKTRRGLRIDRVRITNFLAFARETIPNDDKPEFGSVNLFVGPNGSGKSSLLNALKHVAHRVGENSGMTLSADRDYAPREKDGSWSGRAAARDFCLEHHDPSAEWRIEADVAIGVGEDAQPGTVWMECGHPQHRSQPPWMFRPAGGTVRHLRHASPLEGVALEIRDGVFPMGWPRRLFNHDQRAFEADPATTAEVIEGPDAWERLAGSATRLVGPDASSWRSDQFAAAYTCGRCAATEHWPPPDRPDLAGRRGIGYALLDRHGTPLLHGSDGVQQATFMLVEIHKHERPTAFVIEEPDVFLHPGLQIRLMEVFQEIARDHHHQFFISTHSPYLIDWAALAEPRDTRLFRVRYDEQRGAKVSEPLTDDAGALLDALGHSPAQVLQPNGVIWVEGPSDAIYIQTWLELWWREHPPSRPARWGLDASIQAYGGTLLKYFTGSAVEGPDLPGEKFRALRKAGLRGVIVMDYDRGPNDQTWWRDCKQDIVREFSPEKDGRWSTWLGHKRTRSIECYARRARIEAAGMKWSGEQGWEPKSSTTKVKAAAAYRRAVIETARRNREEPVSFAEVISDDAAIAADLTARMRQLSDAIESWRNPKT